MEALLAAKAAARTIGQLPDRARRDLLDALAAALRRSADELLKANEADVAAMAPADPRRDRLLLTPERLAGVAAGVEAVARLGEVLWEELEARERPSGIRLRRVRVPLGVVGCIYEARPNVTVDVAALCLRTGNVAVLKGGK